MATSQSTRQNGSIPPIRQKLYNIVIGSLIFEIAFGLPCILDNDIGHMIGLPLISIAAVLSTYRSGIFSRGNNDDAYEYQILLPTTENGGEGGKKGELIPTRVLAVCDFVIAIGLIPALILTFLMGSRRYDLAFVKAYGILPLIATGLTHAYLFYHFVKYSKGIKKIGPFCANCRDPISSPHMQESEASRGRESIV